MNKEVLCWNIQHMQRKREEFVTINGMKTLGPGVHLSNTKALVSN